jgi:uncharacterized protein (DUF3084 family)
MRTERKLAEWATILIGIGGAALISYGPLGGYLLTRAAVRKIVEYFRGAEATLRSELAEKDTEVERAQARLDRLNAERAAIATKLEQVQQATSDVEQEQTYDGRFEDPDGGYLKSAGAHGVYNGHR